MLLKFNQWARSMNSLVTFANSFPNILSSAYQDNYNADQLVRSKMSIKAKAKSLKKMMLKNNISPEADMGTIASSLTNVYRGISQRLA